MVAAVVPVLALPLVDEEVDEAPGSRPWACIAAAASATVGTMIVEPRMTLPSAGMWL